MERGEEHLLEGNRREDGEKTGRLFDLVVGRQGGSRLKASVFSNETHIEVHRHGLRVGARECRR